MSYLTRWASLVLSVGQIFHVLQTFTSIDLYHFILFRLLNNTRQNTTFHISLDLLMGQDNRNRNETQVMPNCVVVPPWFHVICLLQLQLQLQYSRCELGAELF